MLSKAAHILFILLCVYGTTKAQAPSIIWEKNYGGSLADWAFCIEATPDSGYIILGETASDDIDISFHHGDSLSDDIWVVKIDKNGFLQWQKPLGGSGYDVVYFGSGIKPTPDGGYVLTGGTLSTDGDITGAKGGGDAWVVKLDNLGVIQWQKCLGGSLGETGRAIDLCEDGGYIIAGATSSTDGDVSGFHGGANDAWVVKLDSLGNLQWQKCLGGGGSDDAFDVIALSDYSCLVLSLTGSADGDVTANHGGGDAWVVKLDSTGTILWQKCYGGSNGEVAFEMTLTADGGFALLASTDSNDGDVSGLHGGVPGSNSDYWLAKMDSQGNLQWQKCYGGTSWEYVYSIQQTQDGGYLLGGETTSTNGDVNGHHGAGYNSDIWVVKTDSAGNLQWQKCLGGAGFEDIGYVRENKEGGYIVVGIVDSVSGDVSAIYGDYDIWVVKLGFASGTGDTESPGTGIFIYPNPNSGAFTVALEGIENFSGKVEVYNLLGLKVMEQVIDQAKEAAMSINSFSHGKGIYLLKLCDAGGACIKTARVVVE